MPSDRTRERLRAFALGATPLFDLTGLIIYVLIGRRLPVVEPQRSSAEPFRYSAKTIDDAHREALGVSPSGTR